MILIRWMDNNNVQNIETYIDDSNAQRNTNIHQQLLPEEHIEKTKKGRKIKNTSIDLFP